MGLIRYAEGDIVNDTQRLGTSTWYTNTNKLTTATMKTSSVQNANNGSPGATALGSHYINVYYNNSLSGSEFSVAYGHIKGSGSLDYTTGTGGTGFSPSKVIYNQYRQLVFGDENSSFSFNGYTPDHIYVVNVSRARYKHNLKPASMMLTLTANGAAKIYTDDSITTSGSAVMTNAGRQFNIVEGTTPGVMTGGSLNQSNTGNFGSYGLFYPDSGFMVFNPDALDDEHGGTAIQPDVTSNLTQNDNHEAMVQAIQAGNSFILDSEEKVSSQFYFTRARNSEFNYTTNPSFVDTNGSVNITSFIDNPTTYITTVGMYNDSGDLVAVAKLSQPVTKDFTKEALIRVKLDY
jgi:hypothetical protein